jgi:hypothetical protein
MEPLTDFKLRELIRLVECNYDYECYKNGIDDFQRIKPSEIFDLALCNSRKCNLCNYATIIGEKKCCMCPVLNHLRKRSK